MNGAETIVAIIASAATSAAVVHGIYRASKTARLAAIEARRAEAAHTLRAAAEAAAEIRLREQEAKNDDRTSTAAILNNLATSYDAFACTVGAHVESLEKRVRDLEAIVNDRDSAIAQRDNVIRRLRDHVHTANNELAKAGLAKHIMSPDAIVAAAGGHPDHSIAPDRRTRRIPNIADEEQKP